MSENDPELSRLYREASSEEPPAVVDAAILAAAWKPAATPQRSDAPQRGERSLWSRWIAPAGAIATLVLGVSIALLVERERPETIGGTAGRQTPQRTQSWPPAPVTESAKPKPDDGAAAEAAAKMEAPAAAAAAPPAPAQAPDPAAPAQAPELSTPAPVAPAPSAAEAFPGERRAKAAAPTTAAPTAATESNTAGDSALGSAGAGAPAAPAAAGELAPLRQEAVQRSPEAWLEEIGRLKREGRDKEAAEQLSEFRKAHPAHAVPENLLR